MATSATPATGIAATAATRGRFVWHELMTTDPSAAASFYAKVVGWKTSKMDGVDYTFFLTGDTPDTMIGGLMTLPAEAAAMGFPPSWTAYIEVPDVDATVDQTVKLGGKVLMPAKTMEMAGRFAILQDPYGAAFAIIASAKPLQPETDPQPREFSWHELTTDDLSRAVSFYEQVFGWEKKSEFDMGDMGIYHMFGRDRFTYGGMMKRPKGMPVNAWVHYARVADTADAAAERAVQAGGTVILAPMEVPGGDRIAVIRDGQGAVFAVHSKA